MKVLMDECYGTYQHGDCPKTASVMKIQVAECNCLCHSEDDIQKLYKEIFEK